MMSAGARRLALLLSLTSLAGCSAPGLYWPGTTSEIDELLRQQRYGIALSRLQEMSQKDPDNSELVKRRHDAIYQAFRYEQQVIAEAGARHDEGDWQGALAAVDAALARYPESAPLQQARTEFKTGQERRLAELDTDLMLARGNWLLEQKGGLEQRRALAGASWTDGWRLTGIDDELARLRPALLEQGQRALQEGKLDRAGRCFTLAQQIAADEVARAGLDAIRQTREKQRTATRKRQHTAEVRQVRRQYQAYLATAREALAKDDLIGARDALAEAREINSEDPVFAALAAEHRTRQEQRVEALLSEGSSLYRRGLFHEARDLWQEVVVLDPDNTLAQSRLDRANRVIEKLEHLRSQQLPAQP